MTEKECVHYWIIETAESATSAGVCKFCGAQNIFNNNIEYDFRGERRDSEPEEGWLAHPRVKGGPVQ